MCVFTDIFFLLLISCLFIFFFMKEPMSMMHSRQFCVKYVQCYAGKHEHQAGVSIMQYTFIKIFECN